MIFYIIGFILGVIVIFIAIHLRLLNVSEIITIANQRRLKYIATYFNFNNKQTLLDTEFKKQMPQYGSFFNVNFLLNEFPSYAASLLKYKKHEWIIIAFEKNKRIECFWLNKGPNNKMVASILDISEIESRAIKGNFNSILIFHNHPGSPLRYYEKLLQLAPSDKDHRSALNIGSKLNESWINLLEFTCARGLFFPYFCVFADSFYAISDIQKKLLTINGISYWQNFKLHWERIFFNKNQYDWINRGGKSISVLKL